MDVIIPLITFLGLGSLCIVVAVRLVPPGEREWMRKLLLASLLLRLSVATAFAMFPELRVFHEDANGYEVSGIMLASVWYGEYPPFLIADSNTGFLYLAGTLNFLFGRFRPVLSYFNCIVGTVLVFLVYRLSVRFFHARVGRLVALFVGLMPSMILWSSVALKDVVVTLLLVVALSSCVELKERVTLRALAGALLPVVAVLTIRFYMTYFVGFAIIVSLVLDRGGRFLTGIYKQVFLGVVVVGLLAALGMTDRPEQDMRFFSLEYASNYRRGMAISANSGFDPDVDVSTPGNALAYLPIGMAHLLWAPFPWQLVSLRPLLAAPETIFWWFLLPATVRGIVFAIRYRFSQTSALLIFSASSTCAYSLIHGNIGSAFRQRAQILVFLFIFSAAGIYLKRLQKAGIDPANVLSTAGGAAPPQAAAALVHAPTPAMPLRPLAADRLPKA